MNLLFKPIWAVCCALMLVLGSCQKVAIDGNEDGGKESKTGEKVTLTVNVNQIELVPFDDISAAKQALVMLHVPQMWPKLVIICALHYIKMAKG